MALECLSSPSLAEWVMDVPEQQFSAGESPKAEVIYLCTQCPAHSSAAWPCMGKHPRLPVWDQLSWPSQRLLTWMCAWRNCPKATKAPSIHSWCLGQTGSTFAGGLSGWVTEPQSCFQLPKHLKECSKMQEFSISVMAGVGMSVNGMGCVFQMRAKSKTWKVW